MKLKYKEKGKEKEIEVKFTEFLKVYWALLLAEIITVSAIMIVFCMLAMSYALRYFA